MALRLDPELEKIIREKVESGQYRDPDDVLHAAFSALDEQDARMSRLKESIVAAESDIDRGLGVPFDDALYEQIKRNARRKIAEGHTPDPDVVDVGSEVHFIEEHEERHTELQKLIQVGLDQMERGEIIDITPEYFDNIMDRVQARIADGVPVKDAVKP